MSENKVFRIHKILKQRKKSFSWLAFQIGADKSSLGKSIKKENPTTETLTKIAVALEVEIQEIFISSNDFQHIYDENNQWQGILKKCKKE